MLKKTLFALVCFFNVVQADNILVIPIHGIVDYTQECILRRGLKQAQKKQIQTILLDINTPGGSVENMLNMIDCLQKSQLNTLAYVNHEAISAGSFIANACDTIYFHPNGIMGSAAVIDKNGQDLEGNLQAKIDSYLWAKLRTFCQKHPHRYQIQRAMMDKDFVLKHHKKIIKPAGELLTVTAREAEQPIANFPALSSGTFASIDDILHAHYPQNQLIAFAPTGFEALAQAVTPLLPILSGLGFFLLMLEFKTPGFGLMGLLGIGLLSLNFFVQFLAGLGGTEAFALLGLGIITVFADLLMLGTFWLAFLGLALIGISLGWSGLDVWPNIPLTLNDLMQPIMAVIKAFLWFMGLFLLAYKLGWIKHGLNHLTLRKAVPKPSIDTTDLIGQQGITLTPLLPSGKIGIDGIVLDARSAQGDIPNGTQVTIIAKKDFEWVVQVSQK